MSKTQHTPQWVVKGRFIVDNKEMQTSFTLCSTDCMEEDATYLCDLLNERDALQSQNEKMRKALQRILDDMMEIEDIDEICREALGGAE